MKVGSVEGTPEEVRDLFENHGLDLAAYIEKPDTPLQKVWLIIPSVLLVVFFGILSFTNSLPEGGKVFVFLLGFSASVWLGISIHIRFKSAWGAGSIMLAGLLIMLVALGVLAPSEILEHYKTASEANA